MPLSKDDQLLAEESLRDSIKHLMVFCNLKREQKLSWNGTQFNLYTNSFSSWAHRFATGESRQLHVVKITEQYERLRCQINEGINNGLFDKLTITFIQRMNVYICKSKTGLHNWMEIKDYRNDYDIKNPIEMLIKFDIPGMNTQLTEYIAQRRGLTSPNNIPFSPRLPSEAVNNNNHLQGCELGFDEMNMANNEEDTGLESEMDD